MDEETNKRPPKIEKKDGKLHVEGAGEFYPTNSIMKVEAKDLQIFHKMRGTYEDDEKENKTPYFITAITANGLVVSDEGLGVIGYKDTYSKELSITIRGDDEDSLKRHNSKIREKRKEEQTTEENEFDLDSGGSEKLYTFAWMCFSAGDWELGSDDSYCLDLTLPNTIMEKLLDLVTNNKIGGLRFHVKLNGLYTDSAKNAFFQNFPIRFFFVPDEKGGCGLFSMSDMPSPEAVAGHISSFSILEKKHKFKENEDGDFLYDEDEDVEKSPDYSNGISNITAQIVDLKEAANGIKTALWVAVIVLVIYILNQ